MKLYLIFFFLISFTIANGQTKTTTLTNFNPSSLGKEVITLTVPSSLKTTDGRITYVRNDYPDGKYSIVGYGSDNKLAYAATNKLGVAKDVLIQYENYQSNEGGASKELNPCSFCKCLKECSLGCTTNWCNVSCLIACIGDSV